MSPAPTVSLTFTGRAGALTHSPSRWRAMHPLAPRLTTETWQCCRTRSWAFSMHEHDIHKLLSQDLHEFLSLISDHFKGREVHGDRGSSLPCIPHGLQGELWTVKTVPLHVEQGEAVGHHVSWPMIFLHVACCPQKGPHCPLTISGDHADGLGGGCAFRATCKARDDVLFNQVVFVHLSHLVVSYHAHEVALEHAQSQVGQSLEYVGGASTRHDHGSFCLFQDLHDILVLRMRASTFFDAYLSQELVLDRHHHVGHRITNAQDPRQRSAAADRRHALEALRARRRLHRHGQHPSSFLDAFQDKEGAMATRSSPSDGAAEPRGRRTTATMAEAPPSAIPVKLYLTAWMESRGGRVNSGRWR
eukprot:scaffold128_cov328-Pavlova_lutheri.AAC.8